VGTRGPDADLHRSIGSIRASANATQRSVIARHPYHGVRIPILLSLFWVFFKKRGRKLLVGCPVVVSFLPREWSCLYRRRQATKCFLGIRKNFYLSAFIRPIWLIFSPCNLPFLVSR
jgi:hypothetical protein